MASILINRARYQAAIDDVHGELERRLARSRAPEDIRAFLMEHWARLLASIKSERGESSPDWVAGWDTVQALLWSLEPKLGLPDTEQLLSLLPLLLERLQDGCSALGIQDSERDLFFSELALLHAAVVRAGLKAARNVRAPIPEPTGAAESLTPLCEDISAPVEKQIPARVLAVRIDHGDPKASVRNLAIGDRVGFAGPAGEKILRLHWVSAMQGMFLFVDEHGYDALSLTRARLEEKFSRGEARRLDKNPANVT